MFKIEEKSRDRGQKINEELPSKISSSGSNKEIMQKNDQEVH